MVDPTIPTLLTLAATVVGETVAKEAIKDTYGKLKGVVASVFGMRAGKAVAKLDDPTTRDEGQAELSVIVPETLNPDEAAELEPLVTSLLEALKAEGPVRDIAKTRMALDLDVGGNALIRKIQGVKEMAVRATTKGDFTLEDVSMDPKGGASGN